MTKVGEKRSKPLLWLRALQKYGLRGIRTFMRGYTIRKYMQTCLRETSRDGPRSIPQGYDAKILKCSGSD